MKIYIFILHIKIYLLTVLAFYVSSLQLEVLVGWYFFQYLAVPRPHILLRPGPFIYVLCSRDLVFWYIFLLVELPYSVLLYSEEDILASPMISHVKEWDDDNFLFLLKQNGFQEQAHFMERVSQIYCLIIHFCLMH